MSDIEINRLLSEMRAMAELAKGSGAAAPGMSAAGENGVEFGDLLKQSLDKVNELQNTASSLGKAFETGDPNVTLPEVMVALQKASLSFQAMTQVRNRLISAYQDIMNMPI